jgi:hypothetical protein
MGNGNIPCCIPAPALRAFDEEGQGFEDNPEMVTAAFTDKTFLFAGGRRSDAVRFKWCFHVFFWSFLYGLPPIRE